MQTVLLAAQPEVKAMPMVKGLILNAAAIDATRSWVTRIQEPLAGLANLLIPMWGFVPPSDPTRYHREPAEVCTLPSPFAAALANARPTPDVSHLSLIHI